MLMNININVCGVTIANVQSDDRLILLKAVCGILEMADDGTGALVFNEMIDQFPHGAGYAWIDEYLLTVTGEMTNEDAFAMA